VESTSTEGLSRPGLIFKLFRALDKKKEGQIASDEVAYLLFRLNFAGNLAQASELLRAALLAQGKGHICGRAIDLSIFSLLFDEEPGIKSQFGKLLESDSFQRAVAAQIEVVASQPARK